MATVADTFNRADGPAGADWETPSGFNPLAIAAAAGGVIGLQGTTIPTSEQALRNVAQAIGPDQYAQAQLTGLTAGDYYYGVFGRLTADGSGYAFNGNTSETYLFRYVAGDAQQIGAVGPGFPANCAPRIEVTGTNPVVVRVFVDGAPWTGLGTAGVFNDTAGTRILAGQPGVSGYARSDGQARIDSFEGGDLGGAAPTITDVGDESFRVGETGIGIVGTNLGATQGTGIVRICPSNDIADANGVNMTVTAWGATGITFDVPASLAVTFPRNTNVYLFVRNDGGASNASGYVVQITPPPAVLAARFLI